jgi:hypothetical protein
MLKAKQGKTKRGLCKMFKYVYINKDNQILNINSFKRLNGAQALTKLQSGNKQQASKSGTKPYIKQRKWKIVADKIHNEWCIQNGYLIKE